MGDVKKYLAKKLIDSKGELKDAEAKEEYERASEIRDEIERRFPNK